MDARETIKRFTPPIALDAYRKVRKYPSAWEYLGEDWVEDEGPGWDAPGVVDAYIAKLPKFRDAIRRPAPIGVRTEALSVLTPHEYHQNVILEYAYAIAYARATRTRMSVLDWGGGFGFLSFVLAELFPDLEVEFHVREVPSVVRAARPLVPEVTFWDDDECLARDFDLISASGSFQYFPDWTNGIAQLGKRARFVFLSRLAVTFGVPSFATRQHAYDTSYIGWVLNRDDLIAAAESAGMVLVREFLEGFTCVIPDAPGPNVHRAFLFAGSPS